MTRLPLTERDLKRLRGVDADLVRVVELAHQRVPLMVLEGLRTVDRQADLYAQGRTKPGKIVTWTMTSKHIDGKAVDIAPLPLDWNNTQAFYALAGAMFTAAQSVGIQLRYGGDWDRDGKFGERGESDLVHFERI